MSATHTALIVPADVTKPCVLYDLPDEDAQEVSRVVTGDALGAVDFLTIPRKGYLVAVDDVGLYKRLPLNTRAITYVRATFRPDFSTPLVGDVMFMGVDEYGEYADVPDSILRAAGVK